MEGSWQPYPQALSPVRDTSTVEPGRVVGLGATCSLSRQQTPQRNTKSFSVGEFVALDDGRRVVLHEERGFTIGEWRSVEREATCAPAVHDTLETLTQNVLMVVLPDDENSTEAHPWPWLADLATARGLDVSPDELKALPYVVVFTEEVLEWLTKTP